MAQPAKSTPQDVLAPVRPPHWQQEENPAHPNYDWVICTVPDASRQKGPVVKRFPRDQEEEAIAWGMAHWAAQHQQNPDAHFRVPLQSTFTYDPREPQQVAAVDAWRLEHPMGLVRTLASPASPEAQAAAKLVRPPSPEWDVTAMADLAPEVDAAQERRAERDREAVWDELWGRTQMHTKDYAGTYHGQMFHDADLLRSFAVGEEAEPEAQHPDKALAPRTTPANVRAYQWAKTFRLVEGAPDQWAVSVSREAAHGARQFKGFLPDPQQKDGKPLVFASAEQGAAYLAEQAELTSTMMITQAQAKKYHVPISPRAEQTVIAADPAVLDELEQRWKDRAQPARQVSQALRQAFRQQQTALPAPEAPRHGPRL